MEHLYIYKKKVQFTLHKKSNKSQIRLLNCLNQNHFFSLALKSFPPLFLLLEGLHENCIFSRYFFRQVIFCHNNRVSISRSHTFLDDIVHLISFLNCFYMHSGSVLSAPFGKCFILQILESTILIAFDKRVTIVHHIIITNLLIAFSLFFQRKCSSITLKF